MYVQNYQGTVIFKSLMSLLCWFIGYEQIVKSADIQQMVPNKKKMLTTLTGEAMNITVIIV
jgi:hypothetical protein